MKKNPVMIAVIAAAAVALLVILGLPLFSRLVYGRSQAATLFERQLGKSVYAGEEVFRDFLEDRRELNRETYTLPEETELTVPYTEELWNDIQFFVLNPGNSGERLAFFFPGGSYIDQPGETHWAFLDRLAGDLGCEVAVPLYPKLPDYDAASSYAAMTEAYAAYLADREVGELVFLGDSAGGGYALSFAMQLRDAGLPGPEKLILISPWVDVTLTNPNIPLYEDKDAVLDSQQLRHLGVLWAGDLAPEDPVVSPLYGSPEGLGRIMLFTGTRELLYPDIQLYSDALDAAGIEHSFLVGTGMFHGWPVFVAYNIPEATAAYNAIVTEVLS